MAGPVLEPQPLASPTDGELFLVPTITVPPSAVTGVDGTEELYAAIPEVVEGPLNAGSMTYPTAIGEFRANNSYHAKLIADNMGSRLIPSSSKGGTGTLVRTPRFYLQLSGFRNPLSGTPNWDGNYVIDRRFVPFYTKANAVIDVQNLPGYTAGPGVAYSLIEGSASRVLPMPDGTLLLFVMTQHENEGTTHNRLFVFRYDPLSEDGEEEGMNAWFTLYAGIYAEGDTLQGLLGIATASPGVIDFDPFLIGTTPYVAVSVAWPANAIYILKMVGSTIVDTASHLPIATQTGVAYGTAPHLYGGISAVHLPTGQDLIAFALDTIRYPNTPHRRSIYFATNSQLTNNPTPVPISQLPSLSGFQRIESGLPATTTDVHLLPPLDGDEEGHALGWACTSTGEIYATTTGGRAWSRVETPTTAANTIPHSAAPLRAIYAQLIPAAAGNKVAVLAVGDNGLILGTTVLVNNFDAQVWKVLRYAAASIWTMFHAAQTYFPDGTVPSTISGAWGAQNWRCVTASRNTANSVRFWVGGDTGTIVTTSTAINATTDVGIAIIFVAVVAWNSPAAYTRLVADTTLVHLLAVGEPGVHNAALIPNETNKTSRAVLMEGANSWVPLNPGGTKTFGLVPEAEAGDTTSEAAVPIVGLVQMSAAVSLTTGDAYAISQSGHLYRWRDKAWTALTTFGPTAEIASLALAAPAETPADVTLYVGGKTATMSGVMWRGDHVTLESTPLFTAQLTPAQTIPLLLAFTGVDEGVAIGKNGSYTTININDARIYPALLATSQGAVLLACANVTRGIIEVYSATTFSPTGQPSFELVDTGFTFPSYIATDRENIIATDIDIPRPDLAEDADKSIVLSCGRFHRVSPNGGLTWYAQDDSALLLPLGALTNPNPSTAMGEEGPGLTRNFYSTYHMFTSYADAPEGNWSIRPSRSLCAYRGGHLVSAVHNGSLTMVGIYMARQWKNIQEVAPGHGTSLTFLPIIAGQAQPLPDGLSVQWFGDQLVEGDTWEIVPKSLYPIENILVDSPRAQWWRSETQSNPRQMTSVVLTWDRNAASIVSVLGEDAPLFDVCGIFLKGVNFAEVDLQLWQGATLAAYKTLLSSPRYSGYASAEFAQSGLGALRTDALVRDETHVWTPHQFAPAFDQYYITFLFPEAQEGHLTYRILDNSEHHLLLDAPPLGPTTPTIHEAQYIIWSDTLFWDGEGAESGLVSELEVNSLRRTRCRYVDSIYLHIRPQAIADPYFKIGTLLLGAVVSPDPLEGTTDRARHHGPSWEWTPIPNTLEDASLEGVTVVEHFGQIQEWRLSYPAAQDWYRARLTQAFLRDSRMRKAMCWVPNKNDPTVPPRLVRLIDGPPVSGVALSYATIDLRLREVR